MEKETAASAPCVIAEAHPPDGAVGPPRIDAISDAVVQGADAGDNAQSDARPDGDDKDSDTAVRDGGGGESGHGVPAARAGPVDPDCGAPDDGPDRPGTGCKTAIEDVTNISKSEAMMSDTNKNIDEGDELLQQMRREEIRKGKQKVVSFDAAGSSSSTEDQDQRASFETRPTAPAPDIPWEKNAERPPQKLPIRFKDCVGRTFVLPWRKVRTWKGMKKMIESAFFAVDFLSPAVQAGHYDLVAWEMFADDQTGSVNPALSSYPPISSSPSSPSSSATTSPASNPWGPNFAHSVPPTTLPPSYIVPHPNPATGNPPDGTVSARSAVVLPELWEDIIEPGMMIHMLMWPPTRSSAPAPPPAVHHQPQPYPGSGHGHHSHHSHFNHNATFAHLAGTSAAAATAAVTAGFGRGTMAAQPPPQPGQAWPGMVAPPPPGGWAVMAPGQAVPMPMRNRTPGESPSTPKRKGKTMKRPLS